MIVDSLAFLGESIFGHSTTAEALVGGMDALGVDKTVVCPAKPRGYHFGPANDELARVVGGSGGRLSGIARVDPLQGSEACAELERAVLTLGLRGLFLHPWEETFCINDARVDAVVDVARQLDVPVVIAAGYPFVSEALQVGALACRFPEVAFVATNGLQLNISGLGQVDSELALADNDNLFIQTSGVYREDFLEGVVRRFGPRRLLYASAYPSFDPRLEIRRVQWAAFSEPESEAILGGNAVEVFSLRAG